jgi:hypothetical protein
VERDVPIALTPATDTVRAIKPLALWVEVSTLTRVSTRGGARRTGESASGASGGPSAG